MRANDPGRRNPRQSRTTINLLHAKPNPGTHCRDAARSESSTTLKTRPPRAVWHGYGKNFAAW